MSEFLIAGGNTSTQAREWAEREGLDVRAPKDNELFLDLDDMAAREEFDRNYDLVYHMINIKSVSSTPSRSKLDGKHVVVTLGCSVTPLERCLLQAILGSDRRREAHSYARIKEGDLEPTLFFEKR